VPYFKVFDLATYSLAMTAHGQSARLWMGSHRGHRGFCSHCWHYESWWVPVYSRCQSMYSKFTAKDAVAYSKGHECPWCDAL